MQSNKNLGVPIILAGLVTAAVTMALVNYMDSVSTDLGIMGQYVWGIIPIGAILVGAAAGSGYGIAAYLMSVKIAGSKNLFLTILCLQVATYFCVQYFGYSVFLRAFHASQGAENAHFSFLEYLDLSAKSMYWKGEHGGADTPIGAWGYALRLFEVSGFCLGGLIVPAVISGITYCEECQRYWRTKKLTVIRGTPPKGLFQKPDEEAKQTASADALQTVEKLQELARNGDTYAFRAILDTLKPNKRKAEKADVRYTVTLSRCPSCNDGHLKVTRTEGHGRQTKVTALENVTPPAHFAKSLAEN